MPINQEFSEVALLASKRHEFDKNWVWSESLMGGGLEKEDYGGNEHPWEVVFYKILA